MMLKLEETAITLDDDSEASRKCEFGKRRAKELSGSDITLASSAMHRLERVKDGLWRIVFHLPTSTNCWLYQEKDGLTLIDAACPWNADTIFNTIKIIGQPLKRIAITHAHPDHAGAAAFLVKQTGATVFAHEDDVAFLDGRRSMAEAEGSLVSRLLHQSAQRLGLLQAPAIDRVEPVSDGDTVGSLEVIHTPGHTPGSMTLWSESARGLFLGDNASNRLHLLQPNRSVFTLNFRTLEKSLQRYADYPARLLFPGHGGVYRSEDAVADLLRKC